MSVVPGSVTPGVTMTGVSDWLAAVRGAVPENCARERFFLEGLEVELKSVDPAPIRWALNYLQPLCLTPAHTPQRKYTVTYLHSDEIVLAAIRHPHDFDLVPVRRHGRTRHVRRCRLSPDTIVYCDPDEGVFWVSDLASDSIFLIVSSRTTWPALALADLTIELVTRYLAQQGWTLFHAGAVDTAKGAVMVVGNSGAGKTSLLLALLCGGARFIANELLFVRKAADGLRVLGFPRAVAIGLGTALQFPRLADLIDSPDELQFPRRRMSLSRIVQTPRSEWQNLEDKLQLLPSELTAFLNAPAATPGATLRAVVVPRVDKGSTGAVLERLSHDSACRTVSNNHMGLSENSKHRAWLELRFGSGSTHGHHDLFAELSRLGPLEFRFGLSIGTFADTLTYADRLLDAMA